MHYSHTQTALNVEEIDRLSFLPYLFGEDFMIAELKVYALARKHLPDYEDGFWHFVRLPQGGGYMMPTGDRYHMVNAEGWFDRTVSAEVAGIILTAQAINYRCLALKGCSDDEQIKLFQLREFQLWNFIESHPDSAAISAALE
ncbi:antirestriction protein (plasmid) [Serratia sp. JSRIV001]|uniref:antirestriction protein n=1 Tax=unclassified Serratia (in: enterobacteria) TaxID=2647522 RepID=UPI001CBEAC37|nr:MULTISPECIES: antirestriction protein [unclassified Serratia (in: enterobacteria)]UAN48790.1 antirestriction protein [Serratia sp. JSRIV001]UAN54578.1 antirestriction protein [Serratia sp. JSRIV002]UAN60572.1 antirestriction protein [Serratia sp. JSRIV004]